MGLPGRIQMATLMALVALVVSLAPARLPAQGTGEFLCSAGSRDGLACESDDDCPGGGVCVIAQGVCDGGTDDGLLCDCPAGTCVEAPVCSLDPSFGTCAGGTSAGFCCDVSFNCVDGSPCVGSSKVCVGGDFAGFACLRDDHCTGSTCESTGRFCVGGDFEFFSCNDDSDCPGGSCSGVALPTETPTAGQTPVATATPAPTNTPAPGETPLATSTPLPTSTPVPTSTPLPTSTATPDTRPGMPAVVESPAPAGSPKLFLVDAEGLPVQGVVLVGNEAIEFTRRISSNRLDLREELGASVPAGAVVRLVQFTPTPGGGGLQLGAVGEAGGCTMMPSGAGSALPLLLAGIFAGLRLGRRYRN